MIMNSLFAIKRYLKIHVNEMVQRQYSDNIKILIMEPGVVHVNPMPEVPMLPWYKVDSVWNRFLRHFYHAWGRVYSKKLWYKV